MLLSLVLTLGCARPEAPAPIVRRQGVRTTLAAAEARLEAPLLHLSGPGPDVVLVGAVHVADPSFYQAIAEALSGCASVLVEGLEPDGDTPAPLAELSPLLEAHGLVRQSDALSAGPGWRQLDRSVAEIRSALRTAGAGPELIAAWLDDRDQSTLHARLQATDPREQALARLALLKGLAEPPPQRGPEADLYWTVLIGSRNQLVLDQLGTDGPVGILYGADHTADLEDRLLRRGWERTGASWLPVITVQHEALGLGPVQVRQLLGGGSGLRSVH